MKHSHGKMLKQPDTKPVSGCCDRKLFFVVGVFVFACVVSVAVVSVVGVGVAVIGIGVVGVGVIAVTVVSVVAVVFGIRLIQLARRSVDQVLLLFVVNLEHDLINRNAVPVQP